MKKNTASTEKMKYTRVSRAKALITEGIEKLMVWIRAYRPLYLLSNLNRRETLMTLMILASWGPTLMTLSELADMFAITISRKLALTTKKSNLFQAELK